MKPIPTHALNTETKELRRLSRRYLLEGLFVAAMFHTAFIGGLAALMRHFDMDESLPPIVIDGPTDIILTGEKDWFPKEPPVKTFKPSVFVNNAKPVLVQELTEEIEDTVHQEEPLYTGVGGTEVGDPNAGSVTLAGSFIGGGGGSEEREPETFTPVEKDPIPVLNPSPKYPDLALRAGVEGTVFVKMWVTKDGSIRKAEVVKSDSPIFDQEAVHTALQWKFTPAVMNNGPVSVWVTVPFRFRLKSN
jgi:protein TonB